MSQTPRRLPGNFLLAQLPGDEYARLLPELERTHLKAGQTVYESGEQIEYAYFQNTSIVSLLFVTENGSSAEMGMIGREGIVGVTLFLGDDCAPNRAVVQSAGEAFRMRAQTFKEEFRRGGKLQRLLLRYTQAFIAQLSQTVVCNRHHMVEQQLCRWLLLTFDRLSGDELTMTQEQIANTLGVRRERVVSAARRLQERGLISYVRGRIRLHERRGLEVSACECYRVVRGEYDRLLLRRED